MNMSLGFTQLIINEAKTRNVLRNQLAYILATAYHETAHTMKPVKEAYWLSESWRRSHLRYYPWYGRGFVQLTWQANYQKAKDELGIDAINNPDSVMDPVASAKIIVLGMIEGWFTGKKLSDYIDLKHSNFEDARRIINGVDKKELIAGYAKAYDTDLLKLGYGVE